MGEGIVIFVPLSRPTQKYEGSVQVNLKFNEGKMFKQITIPLSEAKKYSFFKGKVEEKSEINVVETENISNADVSWDEAIELLLSYVVPVPLHEIFSIEEQKVDIRIPPEAIPQIFLLAKTIGMEDLLSFLECSLYLLDFDDSIAVFNEIEKFLRCGERIPMIRVPIIENIVVFISKNNELIEQIFSPIYSQIIIRLKEKLVITDEILLRYVLKIYPMDEDALKYYKTNIIRILLKIKDSPVSHYITWCYSLYIDDIPQPSDISYVDAMDEVTKMENGKEFITNALVATIKREKPLRRAINALPKQEFITFENIQTSDMLILIEKLIRENKSEDLQEALYEEIGKREDAPRIALESLDLTYLSYNVLMRLFRLHNDPLFIEILYKWTIKHREDIDEDFAKLFYSCIPEDGSDKIPFYLVVSVDYFNRLKKMPTESEPLFNSVTPTIIGKGLHYALKLEEFYICHKTLVFIHNLTYSDFYSHTKMIQCIERFKWNIKNTQFLLPVTEVSLPLCIDIISRCNLHVKAKSLVKILNFALIAFDTLSYEQLKVIGECITLLPQDEQEICIKIINESGIFSTDEVKIAYFGDIIQNASIVKATHIPFALIAQMEYITVDFQFPRKDFPTFNNIRFIKSEWCDFQPARRACLTNATVLVPSSVCILIFCEKENYPSDTMLKAVLSFSGVYNPTFVNCSETKPESIPDANVYVMWKPSSSKEEFLYRDWLEAIKGRSLCVSSTIVKEDPAAFLNGISHTYEGVLEKIEWGTVDESLMPCKSDLFVLPIEKDDLFNSIPFAINDKKGVSAEVTFKNGREFSVFYSEKHLGIFNFDLLLNIDSHGIFSFAALKIVSMSITSLICQVSVNNYEEAITVL